MRPAPAASPILQSAAAVLEAAQRAGAQALDEHTAKAVLAASGLAVPRGARAQTPAGLLAAAQGLSGPLALKALSPVALHKSDIGAVRLNLSVGTVLEEAAQDIAARLQAAGLPGAGFLVEEMAAPGVELVIGGMTDPQLGPMLMLGTGGIHAEVLNDAVFRLCPISAADAAEMIAELRSAPILRGARGRPAADLAAIEAALMALGGPDGLFTRHAALMAEFDLNPVIARPDGLVAVDARIVLHSAARGPARAEPRRAAADLAPLFSPRSIAVAGASASGVTAGNRFLRLLAQHGYTGAVYPIHPSAPEIEGLRAWPSLASLPEPVDYAYLTVPAPRVADVLGAPGAQVRFAQVMASAAPEQQAGWEQELLAIARAGNMRLIGPNCMGTHAPSAPYTFMEGVLAEPGAIGVACQSGGLGMDILRRGQALGLRFSGLVTIGNAVDLDVSDLFAHFLEDPATEVIGLYVEDVKDGARFQALARANRGRKPVVVLVGGATGLGRAAAASHTGAMGGNGAAWAALARQTGMILVETLDAFLDMLQLCLWLTPQGGTRPPEVALFGNGGGASVLATDALDRAGFQLARPGPEARAALGRIALPPGASLANPIDLPASVLKQEEGRVAGHILDIAGRMIRPCATVVHLNLPVIMGYRHVPDFLPNLLAAVLGPQGTPPPPDHRLLVLRSDGTEEVDAWRRHFRAAAIARRVPTFSEVPAAVAALALYRRYEAFRTRAGLPAPDAHPARETA